MSQQPRSRSLVPTQRLGTIKLSLTDDHLDRQLGIQVLPDSRKGQRNIGSPGSRQHVGGPGPAGTAVFQTAYGPHHQLAATLSADAFRAAPDNAGQPAGVIPVYTTGLMLSAAQSCHLHTQRVGTRMTASGLTFYDTLGGRGVGVRAKKTAHDRSQTASVTLNLMALGCRPHRFSDSKAVSWTATGRGYHREKVGCPRGIVADAGRADQAAAHGHRCNPPARSLGSDTAL